MIARVPRDVVFRKKTKNTNQHLARRGPPSRTRANGSLATRVILFFSKKQTFSSDDHFLIKRKTCDQTFPSLDISYIFSTRNGNFEQNLEIIKFHDKDFGNKVLF